MTTYPQFPKNFFFGSATAAFQIEGGWDADGKGPSSWDVFVRKPGKIKNGDTGDAACNTYHDFQTDIDIMAEMDSNGPATSVTAWVSPASIMKPRSARSKIALIGIVI